ncbi:MAG: ferritin-like domain-containing protein [bacterium]
MEPLSLSMLHSRSDVPDPRGVDRDAFARQPLPAGAARSLAYMADIEGHTIVYLRELLATRVVDDPKIAAFLACWFYEESAHGGALAAVLEASGHPFQPSTRQARGWRARAEALAIATISAAWPDFVAVHMTWGAINELTALTAYRRLATVAEHPALAALLGRIARDEARHFAFYFAQAERRLAASATTRHVVRGLLSHFWAPVGHDVRNQDELGSMARYLFGDAAGRAAMQRIDRTIRRLPGCADIPLLEAWLTRHAMLAG